MLTHRVSTPPVPIIRLSLILLAFPLCALARFPIEKWECGPDGFFSYLKTEAHRQVMHSCPHFAADINHCCVVHDDCYGRQKGFAFCNEEFGKCQEKVLEDHRAEPCAKKVRDGIEVVKGLPAMSVYWRSSGYKEPSESELPQLCRPEKTVGVFFDYLYLSCPTMKKSISSCCDQLVLCPDLPLDRNRTECADRAMRCLSSARTDEDQGFNDGHCDRALDRTRKYLALDYIMEGGAHHAAKDHCGVPNQAFIVLTILSFLCGICLLLVTYKYYRLRSQNKEPMYSTRTI